MTANTTSDGQPELMQSDEFRPVTEHCPRMRARWVFTPQPEGSKNYAIPEWELDRAGFADLHPHDESACVLEGGLYVESGGEVARGRPGSVRVSAGAVGRYWVRYAQECWESRDRTRAAKLLSTLVLGDRLVNPRRSAA